MGLADISKFESLMQNTKSVSVHNSAAAKMLLDYDKAMQSLHFCKKYIKDMQKAEDDGEFVPSSMIAEMYQAKERSEADIAEIEANLVEQITNEPLDIWDRKVFSRLSSDARDKLRDVLDDDVIQRVMEMQSEALKELDEGLAEVSEAKPAESVPEKTEAEPEPEKEEGEAEEQEQASKSDDNYGLDVSSTEG